MRNTIRKSINEQRLVGNYHVLVALKNRFQEAECDDRLRMCAYAEILMAPKPMHL
jgi:hypothetical protein